MSKVEKYFLVSCVGLLYVRAVNNTGDPGKITTSSSTGGSYIRHILRVLKCLPKFSVCI